MKLRLGQWVLKGWKSPAKSRRRKAKLLRARKAPPKRFKFSFQEEEEEGEEKPKSLRPVEPAPITPPAVVQPPPLPVPQVVLDAEPPPPRHTGLSTSDLIRPQDRLRESIEGFLMDQRSPHTRRAYGKDLKRFVQFLLDRRLGFGPEALTRTVIIAYKEMLLADGLEHTTVDRHLATLRSFFRWIVDDGLIEKNPAEGVRFLNPKRISRTIGFSDEEVRRLLSQPDLHTRVGALHYAVLMVLFYCGLRRSEVCSLRTTSLGLERDHHVVRLRGKGNAERIVVVVSPVWKALQHYLLIARKDLSVDQPLFSPIRNNRMGDVAKELDPSMIFYIVTKYARAAGIANRVSPHSCRATAISNARDHNVPDRAIQEFAGWASPDMITRYDKRKDSVEKSAAHSIRYAEEGNLDRERPLPAAPPPHPRPEKTK